MPQRITVREIRDQLFHEAQSELTSGNGASSTKQLGQILHQTCHQLLDGEGAAGLVEALENAEPAAESWPDLICEYSYAQSVGSKLTEYQSALSGLGGHVRDLWTATRELAVWLSELCEIVAKKHDLPPQAAAERFLRDFVTSEEKLEFELTNPAWSDSVILVGEADIVIRVPNRPVTCVVELKLGKGSQEIDAAQACLYQRMLSHSARSSSQKESAMAIVHFQPERSEHLFPGDQLKQVHDDLEALIGRMTGVDRKPEPSAKSKPPRNETKQPEVVPKPGSDPKIGGQTEAIIKFYRDFGSDIYKSDAPVKGPTFVRHSFKLGKRVTVNQLKSRAEELRLTLGLPAVPLINAARSSVTFDLLRSDRQTILFSEIEPDLPPQDPLTGSSNVLVGVGLDGKLQMADLGEPENAHLLVAGTTGSGKSEWLRTMIASLIIRNTPETLRFVLIDPKRLAFSDLKESPFLKRPIVYTDGEEEEILEVFDDLILEMERRYKLLESEGVDTLRAFVESSGKPLPRIVCICDEYADLILQDTKLKKAIEQRIKRLGSKARAAGIHLVLATQDPKRDVVTGTIKANMSARVALQTAEATESRVLIAQNGAESLLGIGDLLFKNIGMPRRYQAPYLPPEQRQELFGAGLHADSRLAE